jgi:predicted HTH domain antitoxin
MFPVGGHLYAGPAELAFVPHTRNRPKDRVPRVLRWEQLQRVEALTRPAPARVSAGSAAGFAGVDRLVFAAECQRHGIPVIDYPAEELRAEVEALRRRAS